MIINIVLLFVVFGAQKKKKNPYLAALLLGVIKAAIYALFTRNLLLAIIMGAAFAALASAFVYFLQRLDKAPDKNQGKVPTYGAPGSDKIEFKWEYFPLVLLLLLLIGGEALLA
jgi:multisubunit Na+/H+ antiporter MnhB subunit